MKFFSLFADLATALTSYPPEKMPKFPIEKSLRPVRFVISNTEVNLEFEEMLLYFEDHVGAADDSTKRERLTTLQSCRLTKLVQYRDMTGGIPHETILGHIDHQYSEPPDTVHTDKRIVRVERLRELGTSETSKSGALGAKLDISRGGLEPSRYSYRVHSDIHQLIHLKSYQVVRSFEVPANAQFSIIDMIVLATSINTLVSAYTGAHYMCLWWAAVFFSTAAKHCRATATPGTAYSAGGKCAGVQLVTEKGDLLLSDPSLFKNLFSPSKSLPEETIKGIERDLDQDVAQYSKNSKKVTPSQVEVAFQSARVAIEKKMLEDSPYTKQKKAEEIALKELLARKDQVLARKDQVLARKDQVLARMDQDIAQMDQDIARKDQETLKAKEDIRKANEESHKAYDKMVIQKQAEELARHKAEAAARDAEVAHLVAQLASVNKSPTA